MYFTAAELCEKLILADKGNLPFPGSGHKCYPQNLWAELTSTRLVVPDEIGARERVSDFHYDTVKRVLDIRKANHYCASPS